jgi:helicase required for RNAi-mediated heterochromatin assembly 1
MPSANMDIREYFNNGRGNIPLAGWQMKPELPTVNEIMGTDHPEEEFKLTTNQIHGPWSSTHSISKPSQPPS